MWWKTELTKNLLHFLDISLALYSFINYLFCGDGISVIFFMVIAMMMKLLWDTSNEDNVIGMRVSETSGLLSQNVEAWSIALYGTNEDDTKSNSDKSCTSSSDDLYDGKICVLCYDDQRSCLFMPCGHFITCYTCAKRYADLYTYLLFVS